MPAFEAGGEQRTFLLGVAADVATLAKSVGIPRLTSPPKVAFIAPREVSRMTNDAFSWLFGSLATRLSSRGAVKATFGGHTTFERCSPTLLASVATQRADGQSRTALGAGLPTPPLFATEGLLDPH